MIALDWAEDRVPELKQFKFVFLILLRHVDNDECLESVIMEQHGQLKSMKVTPAEMRSICQEQEGDIMYIFDGFDEYTLGTNSDIDEILKNGKYGSFVLVSSRPGDFLQPIRSQSDEEVSITGFSKESKEKCARRYLGDQMKSAQFFAEAKQSSLAQLLHIPIILLMACTVYLKNKFLPNSVTKLFDQIVDMSISRTSLKTMGKRASDITNLAKLKIALGKLAWEALQRQSKQLLIFKVSCAV